MRIDPGKRRPVNIRDPELLTLQVVATLAANPSEMASVGLVLCSLTGRMHRTPSEKSADTRLGLEHLYTEPRGLTREC